MANAGDRDVSRRRPGGDLPGFRIRPARGAALTADAEAVYGIWCMAGRGGLPSRREIRTAVIAPYSSRVAFLDVTWRIEGERGYRVRYCGDLLDQQYGNHVGVDIVCLPPSPWRDTAVHLLSEAVRLGEPIFASSEQGFAKPLLNSHVRHLILPLSEDGSSVTGLMLYSEFEASERRATETNVRGVEGDPDATIHIDPKSDLSEEQARLIRLWEAEGDGGMPSRRLFHLLQNAEVAPRMAYLRAQLMPDGGNQISVLFQGSELIRRYGDMTGLPALSDSPEQSLRRTHHFCGQAIRARRPVLGVTTASEINGKMEPWHSRILILPLSECGRRVTGLLVYLEENDLQTPTSEEPAGSIYSIMNACKAGLIDRATFLRRVCANITEEVGATRASVWTFNEAEDAITCLGLFDRRDRSFSRGAVLKEKDFSSYFEAMRRDGRVVAVDAAGHRATACFEEAYFAPNGIRSLLDHVVIRNGKQIAILCCEQCGEPKRWTAEHERYLTLVSAQIGTQF